MDGDGLPYGAPDFGTAVSFLDTRDVDQLIDSKSGEPRF